MIKSVRVAQLSTGSVYKLMALGSLFGFVPLFLLFGVLAYAGLLDLSWNGAAVTGAKAIVVAPLMGLFAALVVTLMVGSAVALGLWLYARVRPVTLDFVALEDR